MTEKKSGGGLGFRDLNCFNLAMLAKFGWRLLMDNHSLVSRVLKANYYPESSFLEAKDGLNSSWAWLSILEGRKVIQRGIRWKVGNGRSIRVAYDPWLPRPTTFNPRWVALAGRDLLVCDPIEEASKNGELNE